MEVSLLFKPRNALTFKENKTHTLRNINAKLVFSHLLIDAYTRQSFYTVKSYMVVITELKIPLQKMKPRKRALYE